MPDTLPTASPDARLVAPGGGALTLQSLAEVSSFMDDFLYIGVGLTSGEFTEYLQAYNFGTRPPDYLLLHHTEVPGTLKATRGGWTWDAGESGKTPEQVYRQRRARLGSIRDVYRNQNGWDRGPHLFIDDRYVWLFTPMRKVGLHAKEGGNEFTDAQGRRHYSIGIEVVGNYTRVTWPPEVERMVGHAVAALKQRLGTFELEYRADAPRHTAKGRVGSICSHRDFNKPSCPGDAVTESYYVGVLRREWNRLHGGAAPALTADSPLLGPPSGERAGVEAHVRGGLPGDSEYLGDVGVIVGLYWTHAPGVGVDPFLAAAQMVLETDGLRDAGAGRPQRNPARLRGAGGALLSFASWDDAVRAHLGRLLALALPPGEGTAEQRAMMQRDPGHDAVDPALRGAARTLRGLGPAWGGGADYAEGVVSLAARMG